MAVPFTEKFVRQAWEANREESDNVYHHPREDKVVKKCIDLSCRKPLTNEHKPNKQPESGSPEKWLEAYIIQLAKQSNNYRKVFELAGGHYHFLYSQLNFRETASSKARPLDCLLYEPATHNLVVVELKATRTQRNDAIEELEYYAKEVLKIKDDLREVFGLDGVTGVEGYVVWPGDDKFRNKTLSFGGWGLIGYSDTDEMVKNGKLVEPWKRFKSLEQILTMKFIKFQPSKVIKQL